MSDKKLRETAAGGFVLPEAVRAVVSGHMLTADSRKVTPGDVFVACRGEYADGRDYLAAALKNGAAFVFWDDDGTLALPEHFPVPNMGVPDLRCRAGEVAAACYSLNAVFPRVWGVTGTNGKTSVTQWLAQAAGLLGEKCGIVGTVGNGYYGHLHDSTHTTPDAVTVQSLLHEFSLDGAGTVAMEVSSHGLDQHRVTGTVFDTAVFTNLTRDHLDYHGDMAHYGASKEKLFFMPGLHHAVINTDDEFGRGLAERVRRTRSGVRVDTYGFSPDADIVIRDFRHEGAGIRAVLATPWGMGEAGMRLPGRFNAMNMAACLGVLCGAGYGFSEVVKALAQVAPASGRMDIVRQEGCPAVVVDYAHTPDALENALAALQEMKNERARLWCVFGCGGDRDQGKRPLMGAAAAGRADCVVVTSDNPRTEDPQTIIDDILAAVPAPELVEPDRQAAITYTVTHAGTDDIVLVAGKGHEAYQDVGGQKHHFSDFEAVHAALAERLPQQGCLKG